MCDSALEKLFTTKELDYMSYIVLRMFENTEVGISMNHKENVKLNINK